MSDVIPVRVSNLTKSDIKEGLLYQSSGLIHCDGQWTHVLHELQFSKTIESIESIKTDQEPIKNSKKPRRA